MSYRRLPVSSFFPLDSDSFPSELLHWILPTRAVYLSSSEESGGETGIQPVNWVYPHHPLQQPSLSGWILFLFFLEWKGIIVYNRSFLSICSFYLQKEIIKEIEFQEAVWWGVVKWHGILGHWSQWFSLFCVYSSIPFSDNFSWLVSIPFTAWTETNNWHVNDVYSHSLLILYHSLSIRQNKSSNLSLFVSRLLFSLESFYQVLFTERDLILWRKRCLRINIMIQEY